MIVDCWILRPFGTFTLQRALRFYVAPLDYVVVTDLVVRWLVAVPLTTITAVVGGLLHTCPHLRTLFTHTLWCVGCYIVTLAIS